MKRKLPSQSGKLDEDLMEKDSQAEKEIKASQETAPDTGAQSGGQKAASDQDKQEDKQEDKQKEIKQEETPRAPQEPAEKADTPQHTQTFDDEEAPGEIPDPFVRDENEDMTLSAPPQRPGQTSEEPAGAPPRKRPVSTEAILGPKDEGASGEGRAPYAEAPVHKSPADTGKSEEKVTSPQEKSSEEKPSLKDEELNEFFPEGSDKASVNTQGDSDDDTWDLGDLVDVPEESSQIGRSPFDKEDAPDADPEQQEGAPPPEAAKLPPWKRKRAGSNAKHENEFTPSLPNVAAKAPSKMGALVSLALVVALIGGTAIFYQNRDAAVEKISRWTGTLNEVGQPVPATENATQNGTENDAREAATQQADQQQVAAQKNQQRPQQPDRQADQQDGQMGGGDQPLEESTISMEVLDVSADEADEPIVGDESVEMPEDVDKFSALQEAIARKRAERRGETSAKLEGEPEDLDPEDLSPQEITRRNLEIVRQTNASLAEYRRALADVDDPALKPRPGQFLRDQNQKQAGDTLPPPSQRQQETTPQQQQQQQQQLYGNRVVSDLSELVTAEKVDDGVRTLEDFDVSVFDPQRRRVSIPRGVTPRLSKHDFPPLEVISFVPDQGIIGKTQGQEGVLLLGETIEGWELVDVYSNYAEFQKQGKKRIVTFNNANR